MLEYVFFDDSLRQRFVTFLAERGVEYSLGDDELGSIVSVPEEIDDDLSDAIDEHYETLMEAQEELLEEGEHALEKNAAGIRVELSDGTPCMVRIDPKLLSKALDSLSLAELEQLVQQVAVSVEHPDDSPLCHTPKRA